MILDIDVDDAIDIEPCIILVLLTGLLTTFYAIIYKDISPEF